MEYTLNRIGVVILAAGKGTRMAGTAQLPKVLVSIAGKPMLRHVLNAVTASIVQTAPVVVIAPDLYSIRDTIGSVCEYAIQESQLGTGHAVLSAKEKLLKYDHILVLYGDHPLITKKAIDLLVQEHLQKNADVTMATVRVPNFDAPFELFDQFARIIRDREGMINRIVERKDVIPEEVHITEVNPGYYIFRAAWLWAALPRLTRKNAQGEYYLPDLIAMALKDNRAICEIELTDTNDAIGINTQAHLELAEKILQARMDKTARMHTRPLPL